MTSSRWWVGLALGGLVVAVFVPRVFDLDAFRTADEKRWVANTAGFTRKLAHGQLAQLVQQPHPGITTQWLGVLTIYNGSRALQKLPLVVAQGVLIIVAGYVFARLWGAGGGLAVIAALTFDPLLYAHTRIYAMDSLLALFLVLSLGLLLLWRKTGEGHYVVLAGAAGAAAVLSKLPGVMIVPFTLAAFGWWLWHDRVRRRSVGQAAAWWVVAFVISAVLILPSLGIAPQSVLGDFAELFRSDEYMEKHQAGPLYYGLTLLFFSTPLQWAAAVALPFAWRSWSRERRQQLMMLLAFAALFGLEMALGAKKGDRYILPAFVLIDTTAALVLASLLPSLWRFVKQAGKKIEKRKEKTGQRRLFSDFYFLFSALPAALPAALLLGALGWQAFIIWQTHPHTLAYVNPLTRAWFGERRHGWGEGLDLAAAYLNEKPNAAALKVATQFPNEFQPYFAGEAVAGHQFDNVSVDYVVVYRAMFERGPGAWETDAVERYYQQRTPEHVVTIASVNMVWVYSR